MISHLESHIRSTHTVSDIAAIVCLESRGFFFAPILALRFGLPCVPIRKGGKLPGEKVTVTYEKEYGPDVFEMKVDAFEGIDVGVESGKRKVILVDDLLGKGGSIVAARKLVEMLGAEVVESVFIFDIPDYIEINRSVMRDMKWYAMCHLTEENLAPKLA
jgi:adenine phosphoribosyltransferase